MREPLIWDFQMILFIAATLMWWAEFIFFPSSTQDKKGQGSFFIIMFSILASIILSISLSRAGIGLVSGTAGSIMRTGGLMIYLSGLICRYWSIKMLGLNFSRATEAEESQALVGSGLYSYLRHPLYLGLFLLTTGIPLFLTNYPAAIFSAVIMFASLNKRMQEEEELMEEVIGTRYLEWKAQRYRFLPFIY